MFAPRTLLEVVRIAKLQERSFVLLQKRSNSSARNTGNRWEKKSGKEILEKPPEKLDKKVVAKSKQKSILGKLNYTFEKKFNPKEMEEHRAQNLCYFYHEKISP